MGLNNFQPQFVPFILSGEKTKEYHPDSDKICAQPRDASHR